MGKIGSYEIYNAETKEYIDTRGVYTDRRRGSTTTKHYFMYNGTYYYVEVPKIGNCIYVPGITKQTKIFKKNNWGYTHQIGFLEQSLKQHGITNVSKAQIREWMDETKSYEHNKNVVLEKLKSPFIRERNKVGIYKWMPKNVANNVAQPEHLHEITVSPVEQIAFDARDECAECGVKRSHMEKWLCGEEEEIVSVEKESVKWD